LRARHNGNIFLVSLDGQSSAKVGTLAGLVGFMRQADREWRAGAGRGGIGAQDLSLSKSRR
jgi:hypothetical protein